MGKMISFTKDERCLVDIYKDKSRLHTIAKMYEALPHIENEDMKSLVKGTIDKLLKIRDKQYGSLLRTANYLKMTEEDEIWEE